MTCPQQHVMQEAGNRLIELVDNLSRFDAVEEIVQERQDARGKTVSSSTRKSAYVAVVTAPLRGIGLPDVREERQSLSGFTDVMDGIATTGLPLLAFIFHPGMRDTFDFACEGLGEWQGQAAWLMHFRQRDDRPNYLYAYRIAGRPYPVDMKGRAWIAANTFQIVHVQAELVRPMPQIELLTQIYIVDYGVVAFEKKKVELWLPKTAELYFQVHGRRYHRRHTFDNFRLFSVDTSEKTTGPKTEPPP